MNRIGPFNHCIKIANKIIDPDSPTFIIAEAGVNHGGDMDLAKKLVDIAVEAGADAVKFQTFKADHLITDTVGKAPYQKKTTSESESQKDMLRKLEVSIEQNLSLKKYCDEKNIIFLTTPFEEKSLEELCEIDIPAFKIASTDTTNIPFLKKVAQKNKPMFLSTGMSYMSEIQTVLEALLPINKDIVLMHCTANYPIQDNEVNLNVLNSFRQQFDILLGYSDHSVGVGATPYTIPLGAKVVEKHFTTDKSLKGPDHLASLNPDELKELVERIRTVEKYMGGKYKYPTLSEVGTRKSLQKCLVAKQKINKGDLFSEDNLTALRTGGDGISPLYFENLVGTKSNAAFNKGQTIEI